MLIERKVRCNLVAVFDMKYENPELDRIVEIFPQDTVDITFIDTKDNAKVMGIGRVSEIVVEVPITKNPDPILTIDFSKEFKSEVYTVKASKVLYIKKIEIDYEAKNPIEDDDSIEEP